MNNKVNEAESGNEKSIGKYGAYLCRKRELESGSMDDQDESHFKQRIKGLRNECDQLRTDTDTDYNLFTLWMSKMIEENIMILLEFKEEQMNWKQLGLEQRKMLVIMQEEMRNESEIFKKKLDFWRSNLIDPNVLNKCMMDKFDAEIQKMNTLIGKLLVMKPLELKKIDGNPLKFDEDHKGINDFGDENFTKQD